MSNNEHPVSVFGNNMSNTANNNSNLYSFLATNYDISSLAKNIVATKTASFNILNLKKYGNLSI